MRGYGFLETFLAMNSTTGATTVGLGSAIPQAIADIGSAGTSTAASREDHIHPHGNQAGGTTHALVTPVIAGFMSAPDKVKLDVAELAE